VVGVSRSIKASDFAHGEFTALPAELSSGDAARQVVASVVERFGRVDILAHVMGGFAGGQSVADTDDTTFEKMLDLNYRAAFYIARAVLPAMRAQGGGRIVAVASRQAVEPAAMVGAYSASKAALLSLVRTIAIENKDRCISANAVLPGTMDTPGNPGAQFVKPAQVAAMLAHLASDAAAQVTGAAIPIYGSQV
jgi:NAD(P)-dependent dehydrogenase (short-subunit alcohol dehydrogenase family)